MQNSIAYISFMFIEIHKNLACSMLKTLLLANKNIVLMCNECFLTEVEIGE